MPSLETLSATAWGKSSADEFNRLQQFQIIPIVICQTIAAFLLKHIRHHIKIHVSQCIGCRSCVVSTMLKTMGNSGQCISTFWYGALLFVTKTAAILTSVQNQAHTFLCKTQTFPLLRWQLVLCWEKNLTLFLPVYPRNLSNNYCYTSYISMKDCRTLIGTFTVTQQPVFLLFARCIHACVHARRNGHAYFLYYLCNNGKNKLTGTLNLGTINVSSTRYWELTN